MKSKENGKDTQIQEPSVVIENPPTFKEPEPSILRILKINKPEMYFILVGCIASLLAGKKNNKEKN